ncbi:hypothetical protein BCR32DRAFT_264741, partial [Anaeromyces robustus]
MKKKSIIYPNINIQSENISFQEKILHIKWCPTMDLLAIINNSYKLTIYRSTWVEEKFVLQKVWSINSTLCQTSIEWRPDGKIIAIGYIDGSLKLIDVETSQIAYSTPYYVENSYITSMTWMEEKNKNININTLLKTSSLENYLPILSRIPNSQQFNIKPYSGEIFSNNSKMGTSLLSEKIKNDDDKLDILLLCDNKGHFHLSVFGLFYLGSITLSKDTKYKIKNPYIVSSYLSNDFHYLSLIVISADSEDDILSGKLENELNNNLSSKDLKSLNKKYKLYKMTFDTVLIFKKKNKIKSLAIKLENIVSHLSYIYTGIKNMKSEYEGKVKITNDNLKRFGEIMEDFGVFTPPITEFMITFVTGLPTQSVRYYLSDELKERGLKNWERTLDVTYANIQKLIIEYVQPGCERLLYYLSDMLGFCKWDEHFSSLGVSETDIKIFIILTGSLIGVLEEMSIEIKKLRKNLKSFFTWLQSIFNKMINEEAKPPIIDDTKGILDFLHTAFSNTGNILDSYFNEINEDESMENNNIYNQDDDKNKSSLKINIGSESLYDLIDKIDIKDKTKLSSKLENWEEYIYQKENERNNNNNNNNNNILTFYSDFDSFMEMNNNDELNNKDNVNSSFNIFNESSILSNNSFHGNRRKLSDEDLQNSPKKQCISMDEEDNILIKYEDSINNDSNFIFEQKENGSDEILKNNKKRSCNELLDDSDKKSDSVLLSTNYKYQGKRPKPIFSNKNYIESPIKYTFPEPYQNKKSSRFKNITIMSIFLELSKKGKQLFFMPAHIIEQSFNLIYSFSVLHDNPVFKSVIIDNETRFEDEIKNYENEFINNSSSTDIDDDHTNEQNELKNEGNLLCKFYRSSNCLENYTAFNLYDKNKKVTGKYLYIFKFILKKNNNILEMIKDDNDDNSRNRVITKITALIIPENSRIIDFEFYNDRILICLIKYHYEDGDIYKLGWVN